MTEPLEVVCWMWSGWRPIYTWRHVRALCRALEREMSVPFRVTCVTDKPDEITCCRALPLPAWRVDARVQRVNNYSKLNLFDPGFQEAFGPRLVSIDLDVLVAADLAPLFAGAEEFRIMRGYQQPYNSSLVYLRAGALRHVWTQFDPVMGPQAVAAARRRQLRGMTGSDQAWLCMRVQNAPLFGPADGVHQFNRMADNTRGRLPLNTRLVAFAGADKPWGSLFRRRFPAAAAQYRADLLD